jgi:hypothetical protein
LIIRHHYVVVVGRGKCAECGLRVDVQIVTAERTISRAVFVNLGLKKSRVNVHFALELFIGGTRRLTPECEQIESRRVTLAHLLIKIKKIMTENTHEYPLYNLAKSKNLQFNVQTKSGHLYMF